MSSDSGARVMLLVLALLFFAAGMVGAVGIFLEETKVEDPTAYRINEFGVAVSISEAVKSGGLPRDLNLVLIVTGFVGTAILMVGYYLVIEVQNRGAVGNGYRASATGSAA